MTKRSPSRDLSTSWALNKCRLVAIVFHDPRGVHEYAARAAYLKVAWEPGTITIRPRARWAAYLKTHKVFPKLSIANHNAHIIHSRHNLCSPGLSEWCRCQTAPNSRVIFFLFNGNVFSFILIEIASSGTSVLLSKLHNNYFLILILLYKNIISKSSPIKTAMFSVFRVNAFLTARKRKRGIAQTTLVIASGLLSYLVS